MKTKLIYLLLASALVGGSSTVFAQKAQSASPYDSGKCATNLFYPIKRSNVFYTVHAPLLTKEITL